MAAKPVIAAVSICLRHVYRSPVPIPCWSATTWATAPGRSVSRTMCSFSSALHRRRRAVRTLSPLLGALLRASYEPSAIIVAHRRRSTAHILRCYINIEEGGGGLTLTVPVVEARMLAGVG